MKGFMSRGALMRWTAIAAVLVLSTVVPGTSNAAQPAPRATATAGTCAGTASAAQGTSGAVAMVVKGQGTSSSGAAAGSTCVTKLSGHWAANSQVFSTAGTGIAVVKNGTWAAPLTTDQLTGHLSGTVATAGGGTSGGTTGAGSAYWSFSIDCWWTYSPLTLHCTIKISND